MRRDLRHLVVAAAVAGIAALAFAGARVPAPPSAGDLAVAASAGQRVRVALVGDPVQVHRVHLDYAGRATALVLTGAEPEAVVELPHRPAQAQLVVRVAPAAPVRITPAAAGAADRRVTWTPTAIPTDLPAPRPADPDGGLATAAIDERDEYGLRVFGVPLRELPTIDSRLVHTAFHGDVFEADCWTRGDELTDGLPFHRGDAYASDVWFRVRTWAGDLAYVPDTRFSRTGLGDRMGLPSCARIERRVR